MSVVSFCSVDIDRYSWWMLSIFRCLEGVDAGGGVGVALRITWVLDVGGVLADGASTRRGPANTINHDAIALSLEIDNFDYNYVNDIII